MKKRVQDTLKNIRLILSSEQREILNAALLLMIPTLLSKFLGVLYQALSATQLGTGSAKNEFFIADTIPSVISNMLFVGVISAVVIPVFVEVKERDGFERFTKVYSTILNSVLICFLAVSLLLLITVDQFLPWYVNEVLRPDNLDANIANAANMMKMLMVSNLILGFSVFITAGLNTFHRFLIPHLAPLFWVSRFFFHYLIIVHGRWSMER
jgi:putative peptidoglycan lipid II flippase